MIALKIIRWLFGYVVFRGQGGYPERFLNFTARSGIALWNMKKKDGVFTACVNAAEYRALRVHARKAGMKLRVKQRHGLPFLIKKCENKKGIFAGAAIFVVIFYLLSLSVWSVEVSGNSTIPSEKVISTAADLGLAPGTVKKNLNARLLQQQIMERLPEISWASVNTRGCTVTIEIKEKVEQPKLVDKNKVCNVKASRTGQIIHMDVYSGMAAVKDGDAVVEGQLLISGIVEDGLGGSSLKHASGKAIAETERILKVEVPLKQRVSTPTGKVIVRRSAQIFGVKLPLTFVGAPKGDYKCETSVQSLKAVTSTLPLSMITETWTEQVTKNVTLTQQQAAKQAEEKITELQKTELKDIAILSSSKSTSVENGIYTMLLTCKCREDIAVESEILVN